MIERSKNKRKRQQLDAVKHASNSSMEDVPIYFVFNFDDPLQGVQTIARLCPPEAVKPELKETSFTNSRMLIDVLELNRSLNFVNGW